MVQKGDREGTAFILFVDVTPKLDATRLEA